jgi:hypothetical protein
LPQYGPYRRPNPGRVYVGFECQYRAILGRPRKQMFRIVDLKRRRLGLHLRAGVQHELDSLGWMQLERREVLVDEETRRVLLDLFLDPRVDRQDQCAQFLDSDFVRMVES